MFLGREMLIANYDDRDDEEIYLIDIGSALDPDYGFRAISELPFVGYEAWSGGGNINETRRVCPEPIHPELGYVQIGNKLAAFVQYIR